MRAEALPKLKGALRALYRTLELPGANPLKDAHAEPPTAPTHPSLTPKQAYGDAAHYYSAKEEGLPYRTKK